MSGYDKSPNYGGPNPSWREAVVVVLVFVLITVAIVGGIWALRRLLLAWGIAW